MGKILVPNVNTAVLYQALSTSFLFKFSQQLLYYQDSKAEETVGWALQDLSRKASSARVPGSGNCSSLCPALPKLRWLPQPCITRSLSPHSALWAVDSSRQCSAQRVQFPSTPTSHPSDSLAGDRHPMTLSEGGNEGVHKAMMGCVTCAKLQTRQVTVQGSD